MPTLTISLSGSSVVNGSKSYTVTDADIQKVIDWAATTYGQKPGPGVPAPTPLTPQQALLAWVNSWIQGTKDAVQRFKTVPAVVPPPPDFS